MLLNALLQTITAVNTWDEKECEVEKTEGTRDMTSPVKENNKYSKLTVESTDRAVLHK